jgi:hypothetical protein
MGGGIKGGIVQTYTRSMLMISIRGFGFHGAMRKHSKMLVQWLNASLPLNAGRVTRGRASQWGL